MMQSACLLFERVGGAVTWAVICNVLLEVPVSKIVSCQSASTCALDQLGDLEGRSPWRLLLALKQCLVSLVAS